MIPAKPLICGVAAVGSVSTAAVVANQYGVFSTSSQEQKTNITPNTDAQDQDNTGSEPTVTQPEATDPVTPPAKTKKDEIKEWLEADTETKSWIIKIKKSDKETEDFKNDLIKKEDLEGLVNYLNSNRTLLKSFVSSLETKTLTFEKPTNGWKFILTTADIEKWAKTISKNNATLKLAEENKPKELTNVQDLNKLFKDLFDRRNVFEETKSAKNILFEKIGNDWKHSKSEIESWSKNQDEKNKEFEIKVKKGEGNEKDLNSADENDLIGLFNYLKSGKAKSSIASEVEGSKIELTLEKIDSNWNVTETRKLSD